MDFSCAGQIIKNMKKEISYNFLWLVNGPNSKQSNIKFFPLLQIQAK